MGADGGLNWMLLKVPASRERAASLVYDLGLLATNWRDEDTEWEQENPLPSDAVVSRYGTDMEHSGMEDLRDILYEIEDDPRTFLEVAEDLATRPEWQMYQLTPLEEAVLRHCSWSVWYDYRYRGNRFDEARRYESCRADRIMEGVKHLEDITNMSVQAWAEELKKLLHWETAYSVETWT